MDIDLILDLEHLLHQEDTDPTGRDRDRAIGRRILDQLDRPVPVEEWSHDQRLSVFASYVEERRRRDALPGMKIARSLDGATWILLLIAGLLGVGTARTVLHYDGSSPVNLFWFLGTLVLVQVLMLIALIVVMSLSAPPGKSPHLGLMSRGLAWLSRCRIVNRLALAGSAAEDHWALFSTRRGLYSDLLRWNLFARVQRAGVAFNIGALLTTVLLLTFTDLAFGWSTTLGLSPELVHRGFFALAGPAGWFHSEVVPGLDTVRAIQWTRLSGGHFQGGLSLGEAAERARSFGPFLLCSLATFGLLPRLLAMGYAQWRTHRAQHSVPLQTLAHERLLERLFPPRVERVSMATFPSTPPAPARAPAAPVDAGIPPHVVPGMTAAAVAPVAETVRELPPRPLRPKRERPPPPPTPEVVTIPTATELLVLWGSVPLSSSGRANLGLRTEEPRTLRVGGADLAAEAAQLRSLPEGSVRRAHFVVEEGVPPTKDLVAVLANLRAAIGADVTIRVHVVDPSGAPSVVPDERLMWERVLHRQGDPYLGLSALPEGAP